MLLPARQYCQRTHSGGSKCPDCTDAERESAYFTSCLPESIYRRWTAPWWPSPSKRCYWISTKANGWLESECSINKWRTARQDSHSGTVVLRPTSQAVWRQVSFICTHRCIYCHRANACIWSHAMTDLTIVLQVYPHSISVFQHWGVHVQWLEEKENEETPDGAWTTTAAREQALLSSGLTTASQETFQFRSTWRRSTGGGNSPVQGVFATANCCRTSSSQPNWIPMMPWKQCQYVPSASL